MQLKLIIPAAIAAMLLAAGCSKPVATTQPQPPEPPAVRSKGCCVVFVIDCSGSMVDTFDLLRYEMRRSIAFLSEDQEFHVILFGKGQPIENTPRKLVPATDENKLQCGRWLDEVRPEGQTDPIPALERAFEVLSHADSPKGKLIYLLTDGVFPDNEKVLEFVRSRNSDRSVRINAILYSIRRDEQAVAMLETIASESDGKFLYVNPRD